MYFPVSINIDKSFTNTLMFSQIRENALKVSKTIVDKLPFLKKLPRGKSKIVILIIALILIVGAVVLVKSRSNGSQTANDQTYVASGPTVNINKKFYVPIRDREGKETGAELVVNVTSLERSNNIIFDGKPLTARTGKDFIVINLEVENSTNSRLTVRAVDFFRLVGSDGRNYAADLQIDPVTVEPVSTKKARTIYIVDNRQKNLKFLIGDVRGSQETVEVSI